MFCKMLYMLNFDHYNEGHVGLTMLQSHEKWGL